MKAVNRRQLDDRGEAHLIALACTASGDHDPAPAGKVKLASSMSHEGVDVLKKTLSSPRIPKVSARPTWNWNPMTPDARCLDGSASPARKLFGLGHLANRASMAKSLLHRT